METTLLTSGANRFGMAVIILAFALPFFTANRAEAAKEKYDTICQLCGMDSAKSETEFVLYRKTAQAMHACCANCARRLIKKIGEDITEITTLDYRARKQVAARNAFYVIDSKRIPRGSMPPYVLAFESRADADEFKDRYGGSVLGFDEMMQELEARKKRERPDSKQ
jgi:nitrous oxide reductase accessory protein NosL